MIARECQEFHELFVHTNASLEALARVLVDIHGAALLDEALEHPPMAVSQRAPANDAPPEQTPPLPRLNLEQQTVQRQICVTRQPHRFLLSARLLHRILPIARTTISSSLRREQDRI